GPLVLVDHHLAAPIDLHARLFGVEQVTVGHPARCDQQRVAAQRRAVLATDLDAVADLPCVRDLVVITDLPLPGGDVGEAHRDVVIVAAQQRAAPDHQRYVAAERREYVCELARDETAADDDQPLRQVGDAHDGVAGVIGHAAFGDGVGYDG